MYNQQPEDYAQPSAPVDQQGAYSPSYPQQPPNYPGPQQPSYPPQQSGGLTFIGQEDNGGDWFSGRPVGLFIEKPIRESFTGKVYSILSLRLVFITILIGVSLLNRGSYMENSKIRNIAMAASICVFFIAYLTLVFIRSAISSKPWNLFLLIILTLGEGFANALISYTVHTKTIMFAYMALSISCLLVVLSTKCTKLDLTERGTTLCFMGSVHVLIGGIMALVMLPTGYASVLNILLPNIVALIVSLYLIFDLLFIMTGGRGDISPDEPLVGAISLYRDMIKITCFWTVIGRFCNRVA